MPMTTNEAAQRGDMVADALVRAIREHGCPNSFSPGELNTHYGCPLNPLAIGNSFWDAITAMQARGYRVTYVARVFHVHEEPAA